MQEELSLDLLGTATVRLVNGSWAGYLQQACARLKAAGMRHRTDGIRALVNRLKQTRPSTYQHCVRVARISYATGRGLGFDDARLKQLSSTAMMHDIGKILVPESILSRPRRPTRFEQFILHLHPNFGALLASYFNLSPELRIRTQHHHERWDGRGYPHKLGGKDIPLMARIVQVADTYDAMVGDPNRPYRRPLTHSEAVAELRQHSGKQFDPYVTEAFLDTYPAHTAEEL
ncbi:MAG TPA: HD domain-containing phosphohydrolase [Pyrinomonadaceae bacterium]|jgi:HD-GYP domain-containing protein (c-di-GMP phosphodiesterase class II)|nr:HD domain-containing phosphohydrolase [Pyrinomonadaceae bacterium]